MRVTLTYTPKALAELATLWLTARDKVAVTRASDHIEQELREDPDLKGELVNGQLRKYVFPPLVFYFVVSPDDRRATVWSVRVARA
jgi:hypothetical protein